MIPKAIYRVCYLTAHGYFFCKCLSMLSKGKTGKSETNRFKPAGQITLNYAYLFFYELFPINPIFRV